TSTAPPVSTGTVPPRGGGGPRHVATTKRGPAAASAVTPLTWSRRGRGPGRHRYRWPRPSVRRPAGLSTFLGDRFHQVERSTARRRTCRGATAPVRSPHGCSVPQLRRGGPD